MINVSEQMKQLDQARAKAEEVSKKRQRLLGEIEANEKALQVLRDKIKAEFSVEVDEIPDILKELEVSINEKMDEIKKLMESAK